MSEETLAPVVDTSNEAVNTETSVQETNTDPYEAEAREQGWRPKEEYEGDPNKWRPAKEFVERGELFGKIDSLGRDLKETRKALKMLQEHHTKVREVEYKRAVDELKTLQKKHLEEGNSDGYLETTELLTDLKAEQKAREVVSQQTQQTGTVDPRFTQWVGENKWYSQSAEMREYADTLGLGYAQQHPDVDPETVLRYVTTQVKAHFKDKFQNPNRNKPTAVEGSSTAPPKNDRFELTEDERKVMNTFLRTGVFASKDEYIAELKRMRG